MSPLVTCVVAVHNSAAYLPEAIDSVLGQRGADLDVVVVDDASSDDSCRIAEAYGVPVRVVRTETQVGPPSARNLGIRASRGEFVAFLDGDDVWEPRKLSIQLARFTTLPGLQCSVTHIQNFWEDPSDRDAEALAAHPRMGAVPGYVSTTLCSRRSVWDDVGLLDEDRWFTDMAEWFLRAMGRGVEIEVLPDVLTRRRLHRENLTRRYAVRGREEFLTLVADLHQLRRAAEPDARASFTSTS